MACAQVFSGITNDCGNNMGGILEVFLANAADVDAVTITDNMVTAITMAASAKFKRYQFAAQTGSMNSNYSIDYTTGTKYVTTDLTMIFNRMETAKRIEITAMAQGELVAIVKDSNGRYWYLGEDAPVVASAVDGVTGTAHGDRNGYSITLQDNSLELPHEIKTGTGGVDFDTIVA